MQKNVFTLSRDENIKLMDEAINRAHRANGTRNPMQRINDEIDAAILAELQPAEPSRLFP